MSLDKCLFGLWKIQVDAERSLGVSDRVLLHSKKSAFQGILWNYPRELNQVSFRDGDGFHSAARNLEAAIF